jgi:phage gpG-like protein
MFNLSFDTKSVDSYLSMLRERCYKIRPLLRPIGEIILKGVDKNFEEQGREGGRTKTWKPLKDITLVLRKSYKVGRGRPMIGTITRGFGTRILERTGRLRKSINMKIYPNRVEIGTDVPYAALHEKGGTIINHLGKTSYVDKRPFLTVTDKEVKEITDLVESYLLDETNKLK